MRWAAERGNCLVSIKSSSLFHLRSTCSVVFDLLIDTIYGSLQHLVCVFYSLHMTPAVQGVFNRFKGKHRSGNACHCSQGISEQSWDQIFRYPEIAMWLYSAIDALVSGKNRRWTVRDVFEVTFTSLSSCLVKCRARLHGDCQRAFNSTNGKGWLADMYGDSWFMPARPVDRFCPSTHIQNTTPLCAMEATNTKYPKQESRLRPALIGKLAWYPCRLACPYQDSRRQRYYSV